LHVCPAIAGWDASPDHSYWNRAPALAHDQLVMTPRIHRLIEALHSGERDDYPAIFEEHDTELLT
jgi:hypothetical protein